MSNGVSDTEIGELALSAFVGSKYFTYYKHKWAKLNPQNKSAWNWAAFFFAPFWLAYRKMHRGAWLFLLGIAVFGSIVLVEHNLYRRLHYGPFAIAGLFITCGLQGNYRYKEHVAKRLRNVQSADLKRLAKDGGTSISGVVLVMAGTVVEMVLFMLFANV